MSLPNVNPPRVAAVRPDVVRIRSVVLAAALVVVIACGQTAPTPSASSASGPTGSEAPPASDAATALLSDPWRPAPLPVDENLVSAIEFICKNPADPNLQAMIEDVPVALVDARGDSLVSLILADAHSAYECRVSVESLGGVPTATILVPPTRLDPASTLPVEAEAIRVVSHNRVDEDTGSRTILIGRVGSDAARVIDGFPDESEVVASMDNGWYYAWWPGVDEPNSIAAVDRRSIAIAGVDAPETEIQGRVGPASWWVDAAAGPLSPDATSIPALISEMACASGQPPEGRVLEPEVFSGEQAVLVTIWVRSQLTGQDCQSNPSYPVDIKIPEPLGGRQLLDGSEVPPRDATIPAE